MSELLRFFGVECAVHRITIVLDVPMHHDTFLSTNLRGYRLAVRYGLQGDKRLEAVAHQIGRIALGHAFKRSGYLADRDDFKPDMHEWTRARRWSAKRLIPEKMMRIAEAAEWEPWQLAEATGFSESLCWLRFAMRERGRGKVVDLPRVVVEIEQAGMAAFFSP